MLSVADGTAAPSIGGDLGVGPSPSHSGPPNTLVIEHACNRTVNTVLHCQLSRARLGGRGIAYLEGPLGATPPQRRPQFFFRFRVQT